MPGPDLVNELVAAFSAGAGCASIAVGVLWRALAGARRTIDELRAQHAAAAEPADREDEDAPLVLLVDDSPIDRALFTATMEPLGVRVVCAESAERALLLRDQSQWAVIVVDAQLPGLSGPDLVRRLKTPVVLLSAAHKDDLKGMAEACGADGWLQKSGDVNAVRSAIARLLR